MAIYNHSEYIESLAAAERERREFAENFAYTDVGQRHAQLLAEQAQNAATLAATRPALQGAVDAILRSTPSMPIEAAFRLAAREVGVL